MSLLHDAAVCGPTLPNVSVVEEGAGAVRRADGREVTDDTGQVPRVLPGSSRTGPAAMPEGSAYAEVWKLLEDVMEYGARCVQSSIACHQGGDWKLEQNHATEAYRRITKRAYKLGGMGR